MTITWNDCIDLLKLAACYDQRTVGEEDVKAWLLVGQVAKWDMAAAQRVLVEHYAADAARPRITPPAITDGIRKARRDAAATFELPVIPAGVSNADYPEWLRARRAEHVDRIVTAWAGGAAIPVAAASPPARSLLAAAPAGLRDEIRSGLARIGSSTPDAGTSRRQVRRRVSDPHRRAEALTELGPIRQADTAGQAAAS